MTLQLSVWVALFRTSVSAFEIPDFVFIQYRERQGFGHQRELLP